jgi:hypothetical protein
MGDLLLISKKIYYLCGMNYIQIITTKGLNLIKRLKNYLNPSFGNQIIFNENFTEINEVNKGVGTNTNWEDYE